jgi:hypothetical protein
MRLTFTPFVHLVTGRVERFATFPICPLTQRQSILTLPFVSRG